jgi:hypothetical protein
MQDTTQNELINRDWGDCEIHSISFMNGSAYFKIFDSFETVFFTIVFHSVAYLLFETNHYQNVLASIKIFKTFEDMKKEPFAVEFLKKIEKADQSILETDKGLKFAYMQPIAGGETIISFRSFEIAK